VLFFSVCVIFFLTNLYKRVILPLTFGTNGEGNEMEIKYRIFEEGVWTDLPERRYHQEDGWAICERCGNVINVELGQVNRCPHCWMADHGDMKEYYD